MTFITLAYSSGNLPPLHIRPRGIEFLLQEEKGLLLNDLYGRHHLESLPIETLLSVIQGDEPFVEIPFLKNSKHVWGYIRLSTIEYITDVSGVTTVHTSGGRDYMAAESPSELIARFQDEIFDCIQNDAGQAVYFRRERLLGVSPLEYSSTYIYSFDSREVVYSDQFESDWVKDMTATPVKDGHAFFRANRIRGFRIDRIGNIVLHGTVKLAGPSVEAVLKVCSITHPVSFAQIAAGQGGAEYHYDWVVDRNMIQSIVPRNPGLGLDTFIDTPFLGLDTIDPVDQLIAQLDLTSFIRLTRSSDGHGSNVPSNYNRQHPWAYYRPESILTIEARGHRTAILTKIQSHIVDETPEEILERIGEFETQA